MSTESSKAAATSLKTGLSPEQKDWLKKLGSLVGTSGGGAAGPGKAAAPAAAKGAALTSGSGSKEGIAPAAVLPIIIPVIIAKAKITCKCSIVNDTDKTLEFDVASLDNPNGNGFEKAPPIKIPQGSQGDFVVVNKLPFLVGVEGQIEYTIDDQTHAFMRWERSRDQDIPLIGSKSAASVGFRDNKHNAVDSARYKIQGLPDNPQDDSFIFRISLKGGPPPGPQPGPQPPTPQPGPQPPGGQDVKSSCLITINNNTKLVLTLADQGHDSGDFLTFPPQSIQPSSSGSFVFVQTPNSKDQDCKGFVSWEVGSPVAAIWRVEWHNPKGEKNTAQSTAEPQTAGFRTISQVGEGDENVPIVFTISGGQGPTPTPGPSPGPAPGPAPGPSPGPSPGPEPLEFNPPAGSRQPTLRKGDKSPDGWVEYLQKMLNLHLGANTVDVDGNFGQKTLNAVLAFQKKNKLQVDGTAGNQTWAALREGTPEKPSTDGRQPHTFEEKGPQARWDRERQDAAYQKSSDTLFLFVTNVGEAKIEDFFATVRVTPPDTKSTTVKVKIGPPDSRTKTDQGDPHTVKLTKFKKTFPAKDPNADMKDYLIEAFFDKELGTDVFKGKVEEVS
jgi:hypothetical protein